MGDNNKPGLTTTSLLGDNFTNAQEIYRWLHNLIGQPASPSENGFIEQVIAIQLDLNINRYTVKVLAEVTHPSQVTDWHRKVGLKS